MPPVNKKLVISVAAELKPYLVAAGAAASAAIGRKTGEDAYNAVKAHLTKNNVPHSTHDSHENVPAGHVYSDHR